MSDEKLTLEGALDGYLSAIERVFEGEAIIETSQAVMNKMRQDLDKYIHGNMDIKTYRLLLGMRKKTLDRLANAALYASKTAAINKALDILKNMLIALSKTK